MILAKDPNRIYISFLIFLLCLTIFIDRPILLSGLLQDNDLSSNEDTDSDGLLDIWEQNGIDVNNDRITDLNLHSLGANPMHRDLFVEVDYMPPHILNTIAINDLIKSFRDSPVTNPDRTTGINLHIFIDEAIPHSDTTSSDDLLSIKRSHLGTINDRLDPNHKNIIKAKEMVFHYALFAHRQPSPDDTSSGESPGLPGMEFMVTLGAPKWGGPDPMHPIGSIDQQEGTFMHELGHNLGLNHGGWDNLNCKPNYLSVMSWSRQMSSLIGDRPLDYSESMLSNLEENQLNENDGIDDSKPSNLTTAYGPSPIQIINVGKPVDWNRNGHPDDLDVSSDINNIESEGCEGELGDSLSGYNDWENLAYNLPIENEIMKMSSNSSAISNKTMNAHSDIGINSIINHHILLFNSIKSKTIPLVTLFLNNSDPGIHQEADLANAILNGTHNNLTSLLFNNDIDKAISQLKELKNISIIKNSSGINWPIDNLIRVLEKSK